MNPWADRGSAQPCLGGKGRLGLNQALGPTFLAATLSGHLSLDLTVRPSGILHRTPNPGAQGWAASMTAHSRAVRGSNNPRNKSGNILEVTMAVLDPQPGRWPRGRHWQEMAGGRGARPRHSDTLATGNQRLSSRPESDRRPTNAQERPEDKAQAVSSRDSWEWDLDKKK